MNTNKITGCSGFGNSSSWKEKEGKWKARKNKNGIIGQILTNKNYMTACFDVF
jgi:hypothetical protein